ncbi:HAD-IIA family hydrolase [Candidatus Bipolaricaulota bacterium]|nr:HAD-IIA family hydrolase [Candidatus Bipolaricaulota bacterium]
MTPQSGTHRSPLDRYSAFLLDVDGVLVHGCEPIPGAAEALARLRERGRVVLLTNNATRSRKEMAARLRDVGFPVTADEVVPSAYVAARHLREKYGPVRFWCLGEQGLVEEMTLAGHIPVPPEQAQWIVVGMDRTLTYDKLNQALQGLLAGARFLATNRDATYPTEHGLVPGAGAVVGALVGMGFEPEEVLGKPSAISYRVALEVVGAPVERALMIGDRLETDILGAQHLGMDTALVLSGVSAREDIARQRIRPTWIAASLAALAAGELEPWRS